MKIEQLPESLKCRDCPFTHYLSISRAENGSWSIGYVEYENNTVPFGLGINDCSNLDEAATRMLHALKRRADRAKRV